MNNNIVMELTEAVSRLKAVVEKAHSEQNVNIFHFYEMGCNDELPASVHISQYSWDDIGGWEQNWQAVPFSDKDADKPLSERLFKVSFEHQGVEFFALMDGAEVTSHLTATTQEVM